MSEQDPLPHISPLLQPVVEAFVVQMAAAFDQVWTRPDAVALAEGFLDGRVVFQVDRSGVLILDRVDDQVS
jgi:hypothetical protein